MANKDHPINGMMDTTLEKIRQMVDSNTIIGTPIHTPEGSTILPVSRVSFGFASGGSDFANAKAPQKDLFGGGSGAGVSITPIAFLVLHEGSVRMIQLADKYSTVDRALNLLPEVVDKVTEMVGAGKDKKPEKPAPEQAEQPEDAPKGRFGFGRKKAEKTQPVPATNDEDGPVLVEVEAEDDVAIEVVEPLR